MALLGLIILLAIFQPALSFDFTPARIEYEGGDWYNDRDCLKILAEFVNANTSLEMDTSEAVLRMSDERIYRHPFLFMTGHEKLKYTYRDLNNLRSYLESGGFLYIDDDYGFNSSVRAFVRDLFPQRELVRISPDEEIFSSLFAFDRLPKIHEHYEGAPEAYAVFIGGKIALLYTYNTNFSDGWAVYETYKDPKSRRDEALKMGANIIFYALFK